jgi:diguanylate cyclase (GGDEF)-like protein
MRREVERLDETVRVAQGEQIAGDGAPVDPDPDRVRDIVLFTQVALHRVLGGAERFTWETERLLPDGSTISTAITARPLIVEGEVVGIIEDFRDLSEGRLARDLAQHLATHDVLTGLPNRLLLTDRLHVAIAQAERGGPTPAVLFCDLDRFKAVNDTWGHAVGDEVLRFTATTVGKTVRRADTVARFGGDEIVVLLPDVRTPDHAMTVARKMLDGVRIPQRHAESTFAVTMSVGIALFQLGDDGDSLVRRADESMYRVKQDGGDGYHCADV